MRVRPNFGLKPERLKDGKSFGIVEIVAEDEVPRKDGKQDRGVVVVRDSVMRGETEAVSFTNEFMRRTLEGGLNVGDVIQDGHQEELARSVMNVATTQEGGWIAKLGMPRWGGDSAANAVPERQGAMKMLRDLADPAKRELGLPSLGEVSNALLQINETIGQTNIVEGSVHMEGSGRKEAI